MNIHQRNGLLVVLFLALLVRVLLVITLDGKPFMDHPIVDSGAYDRWAQRIAEGDVWGSEVFYQDPLYPYWLGSVYSVVGRNLMAARLFQCAFAVLGLWLLFEGVRRLFDYPTALAALILSAFYQTYVFYDAMLLKDFLAVIAVEAVIFFWSLDKKWKWLAFGAVIGVGTLVRGNMLLLSVVAAGLLAWRRDWKPVGLVIGGTILAVLPATIRNVAVAGDIVLTTAQFGPNLYTGNNPENTSGRYRPPRFVAAATPEHEGPGFRAEAERLSGRPMKPSEVDAYWRSRALSYIGSNFGTFLGVTGKRALMLINGREVPDDHDQYFMKRFSWVLHVPMFTFGLFVMPLAVAGMLLAWKDRRKHAMLYLMLGAYTASIVFFFIFARYRLPIVPILMVFAAHGAVTAWRRAEGDWRRFPKGAAIAFLAALVVVNLPLPESIGGHRDYRVAHRNAGLYHYEHGDPEDAALEFEKAAALNPNYLSIPVYTRMLATAHHMAGNPKALDYYIRVTELRPRDSEAAADVGDFYSEQGLIEKAILWYERAVSLDPKEAVIPRMSLVGAYRDSGRYADALDLINTLESMKTTTVNIHAMRAKVYRRAGMWPEALNAANTALKYTPGYPAYVEIKEEAEAKIREAGEKKDQ